MNKFLQNLWATVAVLGFLALASAAHADTLDHTVQIVTGAEIDASVIQETVDAEADRVLGDADVTVTVQQTGIVATVSVAISSDRIRSATEYRLRRIVETALRVPGVVRNGYETIRPTWTWARASD